MIGARAGLPFFPARPESAGRPAGPVRLGRGYLIEGARLGEADLIALGEALLGS